MKRIFSRQVVQADWPKGECRVAIVGEAPGETEARRGSPFLGAAGKLLNRLLVTSRIERGDCLVTNVFDTRPPGNDVEHFFMKKKEAKEGGACEELPTFGPKGYLRERFRPQLRRLGDEIAQVNPNIVIAFGATPLWALTGEHKIGKFRGTLLESTLVSGLKVLPTYHPAFIMRQWKWLATVGADLIKVHGEMDHPEILRPNREIWIEPTIGDLRDFEKQHLQGCKLLSYDIETDWQDLSQITCVGLAPDEKVAISVPFIDKRRDGYSYWERASSEVKAWAWLRRILGDPSIPKLAHNGTYDITWLDRFGIRVRGEVHDSMILAHALQPELPKSLGHLGSMYTNESAWKNMVSHTKENKVDA